MRRWPSAKVPGGGSFIAISPSNVRECSRWLRARASYRSPIRFASQPGTALRYLVETGTEPVQALVDRRGFVARQLAHRSAIAVRAGDGLGDPETGRAALVCRLVRISTLALDQRIDQLIDVQTL